MGALLTVSSSLLCPHGGMVSPIAGSTQVRLGGELVVLSGDSFPIGGCAFNVSGSPHPCLTVTWIVTALRSKISGDQPLTTDSVGLCKAGDGAVQGPVTIAGTQTGVTGL
ncbi:MAG: hypothetical protein WAS07_14435 [Micropruina sp.]